MFNINDSVKVDNIRAGLFLGAIDAEELIGKTGYVVDINKTFSLLPIAVQLDGSPNSLLCFAESELVHDTA